MLALIFASNNSHKAAEIQSSIGDIINIITLKQAGIDIDIPEPHKTLEANATEKSGTIFKLTGRACFSEDTGLEVTALGGEPGVRSARYAEGEDQYQNNTEKLFSKLRNQADRSARFRTVISLRLGNSEHFFEGICNGTITDLPKGNGGFGYDPVFMPLGSNRTFGEMLIEEKAVFSHRKKLRIKWLYFCNKCLRESSKAHKKRIVSLISNQNINESDLINGCLRGEGSMQEELYNRFAPKMYAVCLRYSNDADNAQDLLQEGFIKVFRNLNRFRGEGSFEGWIRRIFVNTSIEYYRKKTNLYSLTEKEDVTIEDHSVNALDKLAEKDIIKLVQDLSPGYRTVFNLYTIEGYSHREIATMLNISEGTSKSQLARAKGILKKRVEQFLDEKRKSLIRK